MTRTDQSLAASSRSSVATQAKKIAYARMFSGTVQIRDRLHSSGDTITAIRVFDRGRWLPGDHLAATMIGKLWGLTHAQVGDPLGRRPSGGLKNEFALPMLESVIEPVDPADHIALRAALAQLAEQDPLVNVRVDERNHERAVSLYGEVQREVLQATLSDEYGLAVVLRTTTPLYVERPRGAGEAVEVLFSPHNPFCATVGLRVAPAPAGSGVTVTCHVDHRTIPLYVYRTTGDFALAIERYVVDTLHEGLSGWQVTDCAIHLFRSGYSSPDGPPSTNGPLSTAADFRKLIPIVLMAALEQAGTHVCAPMSRVTIEAPAATIGALMTALGGLAADIGPPLVQGDHVIVEAVLPAITVQRLRQMLPNLTNGDGSLDAEPPATNPSAAHVPGGTEPRSTPATVRGTWPPSVPAEPRSFQQPRDDSHYRLILNKMLTNTLLKRQGRQHALNRPSGPGRSGRRGPGSGTPDQAVGCPPAPRTVAGEGPAGGRRDVAAGRGMGGHLGT